VFWVSSRRRRVRSDAGVVGCCGLETGGALHDSWNQNDPKDAQVILHRLQIGAVQILQGPMVAGSSDIQELSKTHDAVSRSKTVLWHRIVIHSLPLSIPDADRFHRR
jgi:hypothetical protein